MKVESLLNLPTEQQNLIAVNAFVDHLLRVLQNKEKVLLSVQETEILARILFINGFPGMADKLRAKKGFTYQRTSLVADRNFVQWLALPIRQQRFNKGLPTVVSTRIVLRR